MFVSRQNGALPVADSNRGFQVAYLNESGYNYGYELTPPNGATLTRTVTRDPFRRSLTLDCTTRFNGVEVASFVYSFDAHNRPVTRNNDRFAYNDRDEIVAATIGTNNVNRAYDTIGNHVFCAFNSATNFYANNQLNQTTASYRCAPTSASDDATPQDEATPLLFDGDDILSTNKFTWSAQGGLQRDGRFVYAFDAEDQLTSVTSSHLTNGAIRVVNAYDYRHRRISKTVYRCIVNQVPTPEGAPPSLASTTTWNLRERHDFVYDDWNLIHETVTTVDANSTTNVTEIEYFWGPDLSNTLQGAGGVGGLLAVSMNGAFYFPVYDNLGNIVKYLDESGTVVASYIYDDFGRMLTATGPFSSSFTFLFSTKYFDYETDLYYYGYRFYSLLLRCWLGRDPLSEKVDANLYLFTRNRGVFCTDTLGLYVILPHLYFYPKGTFMESIVDFFKGGAHDVRHYYYPDDTATVRLLKHPEVAKVWHTFESLDNITGSYSIHGTINYVATKDDYYYDVFTLFGTNFLVAPWEAGNFKNFDFGYQVLGSFSGNYDMKVDYATCRKLLVMVIKNTWSVESLTRNPNTRKSILHPLCLAILKALWQPLEQHYHYVVEETVSPLQIKGIP